LPLILRTIFCLNIHGNIHAIVALSTVLSTLKTSSLRAVAVLPTFLGLQSLIDNRTTFTSRPHDTS
jgi:hypothetical protein